SHGDAAVVSEKIWRVQKVNVQRMAFDPFAAVEQPPQLSNLGRDVDTERGFERVDGGHLVGHRTDAANPCRDVGDFFERAAPQQGFEKPRRLVNIELHVFDRPVVQPDVQRPLAFDATQGFDANRSGFGHYLANRSLSTRNSGAYPLKFRN